MDESAVIYAMRAIQEMEDACECPLHEKTPFLYPGLCKQLAFKNVTIEIWPDEGPTWVLVPQCHEHTSTACKNKINATTEAIAISLATLPEKIGCMILYMFDVILTETTLPSCK